MTTVLVIDDESIVRRLVKHALKSLEIDVIEAENATTGFELLQTTAVDLVLIDINLPDIDGFSIIEELQTIPHMQGVPLITFTARSEPGDERHALELGASGFLYKPFHTQELRDLVTRLLS